MCIISRKIFADDTYWMLEPAYFRVNGSLKPIHWMFLCSWCYWVTDITRLVEPVVGEKQVFRSTDLIASCYYLDGFIFCFPHPFVNFHIFWMSFSISFDSSLILIHAMLEWSWMITSGRGRLSSHGAPNVTDHSHSGSNFQVLRYLNILDDATSTEVLL